VRAVCGDGDSLMVVLGGGARYGALAGYRDVVMESSPQPPVIGYGWWDGRPQPPHRHTEGQLIYPVAGLLAVTTETGTWVAGANQVAWTPGGCEHSHRASTRTEVAALVVPEELSEELPMQPAVFAVSPLMREAMITLAGARTLRPSARRRLEGVVVDELLDASTRPLFLPEPQDGRLKAATELLRADLTEARTLPELGRAVGASGRTLSRLFNEELGMTFHQWRTQLRVQHALVYLWHGHSVSMTAALCGWSNPSSFIEAFESIVGQTPGRYQVAQDRRAFHRAPAR
jgi:AraC-like DNA-binding protein